MALRAAIRNEALEILDKITWQVTEEPSEARFKGKPLTEEQRSTILFTGKDITFEYLVNLKDTYVEEETYPSDQERSIIVADVLTTVHAFYTQSLLTSLSRVYVELMEKNHQKISENAKVLGDLLGNKNYFRGLDGGLDHYYVLVGAEMVNALNILNKIT